MKSEPGTWPTPPPLTPREEFVAPDLSPEQVDNLRADMAKLYSTPRAPRPADKETPTLVREVLDMLKKTHKLSAQGYEPNEIILESRLPWFFDDGHFAVALHGKLPSKRTLFFRRLRRVFKP